MKGKSTLEEAQKQGENDKDAEYEIEKDRTAFR